MQIAIFIEGLLIIALLVFLLLRKRVIITPSHDWAVISESFTKDVWNQTIEFENRFQQNPLTKLPDNNDDHERLRSAFEKSAQIAFEIGDGIRRQNFYGTPLSLEAYCSRASRWYFDIARNYEGWALAIEDEQQMPTPGAADIAMGAAKGAVRGLLGGWKEVLAMLSEQPDVSADSPESRRVDALQLERDRLNYARAYLDTERISVQNYLGAMFNWQFDEST